MSSKEVSVTYKSRVARKFSIPFTEIKDKILSPKFELSLVFTTPSVSQQLNKAFRKKDKPANILSFPLSEDSGEIFIDLSTAKKESGNFDMKFEEFVSYLFIHGCIHLKGIAHGAKMEQLEKKFLSLVNGSSTNSNRHRHRNILS